MDRARFECEWYVPQDAQFDRNVQDLGEVRRAADSPGEPLSAIEIAARASGTMPAISTTPKKSRTDARPSPSPEAHKAAAAKVNALSHLADSVDDVALKFTMKKRSFITIVKTKADSFLVSGGVVFEVLFGAVALAT